MNEREERREKKEANRMTDREETSVRRFLHIDRGEKEDEDIDGCTGVLVRDRRRECLSQWVSHW